MSALPCPPARLLTKNIRRSSFENVGAFSLAEVLITEPRFTGVCQGQRLHARRETQLSFPPCAPAKSVRSEWKYRLSPLGESVPWESSPTELIGAPTLTGSDQGDQCAAARCAVMLGPGADGRWSESGAHERSNPRARSELSPPFQDVFMRPPRMLAPARVRWHLRLTSQEG